MLTLTTVARISSQAKTKPPTADCFLTWQFDLYNKLDGDLSEEQDYQNYTAQPSRSSYTGKHGRFRRACNWMRSLTWRCQIAIVLCLHVHCLLCYSPCVHNYFGCTVAVAFVTLLACMQLQLNFYIVVSHGHAGCSDCSCWMYIWNGQIHVLVETSIYVCWMFAFPPRQQHGMCFDF